MSLVGFPTPPWFPAACCPSPSRSPLVYKGDARRPGREETAISASQALSPGVPYATLVAYARKIFLHNRCRRLPLTVRRRKGITAVGSCCAGFSVSCEARGSREERVPGLSLKYVASARLPRYLPGVFLNGTTRCIFPCSKPSPRSYLTRNDILALHGYSC